MWVEEIAFSPVVSTFLIIPFQRVIVTLTSNALESYLEASQLLRLSVAIIRMVERCNLELRPCDLVGE
jgi:hypothetical protein